MSLLSSSVGGSFAGVGRNILIGEGEPRSSWGWRLERIILLWALPGENDIYMATPMWHREDAATQSEGPERIPCGDIPGSLRLMCGLRGT